MAKSKRIVLIVLGILMGWFAFQIGAEPTVREYRMQILQHKAANSADIIKWEF